MKIPKSSSVRQIVRIKPGGLISLSSKFIRRSGWNVGASLNVFGEGRYIRIERVPNESEWRMSRLRTRTGSVVQREASTASIRPLGELLALRRDRKSFEGSKRGLGATNRANTVVSESAESLSSREILQDRWQAIRESNESLFDDLATWLERERPELIRELADVLGKDATAQMIARSIRCDLFLASGDAWREDVKQRLMAAAFGFCA